MNISKIYSFDFTNRKVYNEINNSYWTETSLIRNFVSHAKRYQKNTFFLRRKEHYTLWWNVSSSQILSKAETNNNEIFCSVELYARNKSFITDGNAHEGLHYE